jgi:hypothetical protein
VAELLLHVRSISGAAAAVRSRVDAWAGAQDEARAEARLDRQRAVAAAAARTGLSVTLVLSAWAALRYGRVWEVHAACGGGGWAAARAAARAAAAAGPPAPRRWWAPPRLLPAGAAASARGVVTAWQYSLCCVENMGEPCRN